MRTAVLDASALLALFNAEVGSEQVARSIMDRAIMSAINISEVIAKLSEVNIPEEVMHETLDLLGIEIIAFDMTCAYQAGLLRSMTKALGLSFGDRACLALAQHLRLPAVTADRTWQKLTLDIGVQIIR
jgi:PIN domain nuclease of toxin-antitoxin system